MKSDPKVLVLIHRIRQRRHDFYNLLTCLSLLLRCIGAPFFPRGLDRETIFVDFTGVFSGNKHELILLNHLCKNSAETFALASTEWYGAACFDRPRLSASNFAPPPRFSIHPHHCLYWGHFLNFVSHHRSSESVATAARR